MSDKEISRCCHVGCHVTSNQDEGLRVRMGFMLWACNEHCKKFRDHDIEEKAHERRIGEATDKAADAFDKKFNKKYKCKPKINWRDSDHKNHSKYLEYREESKAFWGPWEEEYYIKDPAPISPEFQQSYPIPDETKSYMAERSYSELSGIINLWIKRNRLTPSQSCEALNKVATDLHNN